MAQSRHGSGFRARRRASRCLRSARSALEAGRDEVLADDMTRQVKAGLSDEEGIYLNFDPENAAAAAR